MCILLVFLTYTQQRYLSFLCKRFVLKSRLYKNRLIQIFKWRLAFSFTSRTPVLQLPSHSRDCHFNSTVLPLPHFIITVIHTAPSSFYHNSDTHCPLPHFVITVIHTAPFSFCHNSDTHCPLLILS